MFTIQPNEGERRPLLVTTSWDDGHPSDLRLAELLARHGAAGTAYVPNVNREGRPVMRPAEIRRLGQHLEIGGHTRDHVTLEGCTPSEAAEQIASNKAWLEDLLGREVSAFAYVRGHHDRAIRRLVRNAGFRYARTVRNLSYLEGRDRYRIPVTAQFFPHSNDVYFRNYLGGGGGLRRLTLLRAFLGRRGLLNQLCRAVELCMGRGGCFHLWGHSWELDENGLWDDLDHFLAFLRDLGARFVANGAYWSHDVGRHAARPGLIP